MKSETCPAIMFPDLPPVPITKFQRPAIRPGLVPRPRLWRRLDEGRGCKWSLVSAPAGFGKTVLLSSWAAHCGVPVAWFCLDAGDDDPVQFWSHLMIAWQQTDPSLGKAALTALQSPQPPPPHQIVADLINELAAVPKPRLLVLDDYHCLQSAAIHREMAFLLAHLPPTAHLFLATRSDPPFPLSRFRAQGELMELRAADLRFSAEETAVFLTESMGLPLAPAALQELEKRTEGWIASLHMAALSLRRRSEAEVAAFIDAFSGSHRYVLDYLTDEVLRDQPPATVDFLLQTAVLDRLCAPLCDAVLATSQSQMQLADLEAANLFLLPLDEQREWFRYHHLFADLLRKRLQQQRPDLVPHLHLRASHWYETAGLAHDAIAHAQSAADEAWLADLVERHILKAIFRSEFGHAERWIAALPPEKIEASPILCLAQAWLSLRYHTVAAAEQFVAAAETSRPSVPAAAPDLVSGHITTLQTILARTRGDSPPRQIELAQQALAVIPESELGLRSMIAFRIALGYLDLGAEAEVEAYCRQAVALGRQSGTPYAACGAVYLQALMAHRRGRLRETAVCCRQALADMPEAEREYPITGIIPISLGLVLAEWNEMPEAEALLRHGLALTANGGFREVQIKGAYALARLQMAQRRPERRLKPLPDLVSMADPGNRNLSAYAAALQARLHLLAAGATGEAYHLATAVRWAEGRSFQVETTPDADWRILAQLVLARVRLAQQRAGQPVHLHLALPALQQQLTFLEAIGWHDLRLEALLVQAMLFQALGQEAEAVCALAQALSLAEREGYRRLFLDDGPLLAPLLYGVLAGERTSEYAGELLAAIAAEHPVARPEPDLIEPLTAREVEVLALIADGRTNREIGQALSISLGTVKRHTANINGKLNVHNRTQAVARARTLGILLTHP